MVYRAAWRRGLTTPEIDKLANASSIGERYRNGYWIKGKDISRDSSRVKEDPALAKELTRLYYLGNFMNMRNASPTSRVVKPLRLSRMLAPRVRASRRCDRSTVNVFQVASLSRSAPRAVRARFRSAPSNAAPAPHPSPAPPVA